MSDRILDFEKALGMTVRVSGREIIRTRTLFPDHEVFLEDMAQAAVAEARQEEREMTERALATWGWTNQVCPDGHVGCYLPPGHNHRSNGPQQAKASHPLPEEGT